MSNQAARAELGGFLRMRREAVYRSAHDLPPIRGRQIGLRREEVAFLSAISVTWYTWLEHGRDINPSRQVLDAIGETLLGKLFCFRILSSYRYMLVKLADIAERRFCFCMVSRKIIEFVGHFFGYIATGFLITINQNRACHEP